MVYKERGGRRETQRGLGGAAADRSSISGGWGGGEEGPRAAPKCCLLHAEQQFP